MDYVERKTLNSAQIEYLEQALKASIQKIKFTGSIPPIANNQICDAALIARGSYEISCIASILDIVMPKQMHKERKIKVFNELCKHGLIITD
tara:strand:+ start:437 stop:712 length:276 start_codon:yes stop_codon:yes gene_type:complete